MGKNLFRFLAFRKLFLFMWILDMMFFPSSGLARPAVFVARILS